MTLYTRPTSSRVWEEIEIDESTTINNNNIKICCCWAQFRQGFSKSKWRRKQAHRIGGPSANHDGESTAKTFLLFSLQEEHHHGVTFFDTVVIQSWAISWPTVYHPLWENCNECHTVADTQKKLQWEIKTLKNCTHFHEVKSFTCFSVDRFLHAYPLIRMSSALHTGVPELLLWWTQRFKADKNAILSK